MIQGVTAWCIPVQLTINSRLYFSKYSDFNLPRSVNVMLTLHLSDPIYDECLCSWIRRRYVRPQCEYIFIPFVMMFYHDGLRTITAESARHSSIISGNPHWFCLFFVVIWPMLISFALIGFLPWSEALSAARQLLLSSGEFRVLLYAACCRLRMISMQNHQLEAVA